jgi:hypothetical protein
VRITHPFHPLRGQAFEFVARRVNWGEPRVWVHDAGGRLRSFPAGWTDVDAPDPFDVRAAGRCPFRAQDLAGLAVLVRRLTEHDGVK